MTTFKSMVGLAASSGTAAARLWGAVQRLHHDLGISPASTRLLHEQRLAALRET